MSISAPDQLIIRQARPDDLAILARFSAAMALETEGRTLDRDRLKRGTQAVFDSPDRGFYLVAEAPGQSSGRVIGQLMITYEWSDWRNGVFWWIQSVYVDPSWRRRGVYRRMHEYVIQQARARKDVCGVRLYVEGDNRGAQAAYQRIGMTLTSYRVFEQDFILAKGSNTPKPAKAGKSPKMDHAKKKRKTG